ncbi:TAXI family TRAP transporter solute-binding subunit [Orrella marina]|uniref:Immunogenic protein n=1 Tax=Orrella marina TaxID=2163011 RepID=A0A2R4XIJ0_9BURK|nr:TAXI family TRAP transporter solute-binding subunit [Orrella marina]AWB33573.1 immunogenic protein [Orrella marina]
MKISWKTVAGAALALSLVSTSAMSQSREFFGIATGGTGGTYYPLGGMLAQLISNKATINGKKVSATAESAGASVANAKLLANDDIESAFVAADILDAAYNGRAQFEGNALPQLRALAALYPETVQLITRADSGINSIADLKGKSISSGSPGSGQYQLLTDLLEISGLSRSDVSEDSSSFTQAVDKIKDGNLDATLITAGVPTAAVTDFAQAHDLKVVPIAGALVEKLRETQPYYAKVTLPANTYKGQTEPVDTIAVLAVWATNENLSDDAAYEVTKALFENLDTMGKVHVQGKNITTDTALEVGSVPVHPGALRYFKEKGLVK